MQLVLPELWMEQFGSILHYTTRKLLQVIPFVHFLTSHFDVHSQNTWEQQLVEICSKGH